MKLLFFKSSVALLAVSAALVVSSFTGSIAVEAATMPPLGTSATFGVLSETFTRNISTTTITGDLGYTTLSGSGTHTVSGATHVADGAYSTAGTDQGTALTDLNNQYLASCTLLGAGALDAIDIGGGPGHFTPGCYYRAGAIDITASTVVNLDGAGIYIFKSTGGAVTTGANSTVVLNAGASACDVFWTPVGAVSLGATSTFKGTVIDAAGINIGVNVNWTGRALAFGGTVLAGGADTIAVPSSCSAYVAPVAVLGDAHSNNGTITVVKTVINDNGGTKAVVDFPLFVNGKVVISGQTNVFAAPAASYIISETTSTQYAQTFSGDCDSKGFLNLNRGINAVCVITNNDIGAPVAVPPVPPLIDVVKVPSPLALPNGPGPVTYTYTLRNIGTVPVSNITMVGDSCAPIVLVSGDTNSDGKLDINETWVHTCTTKLTETHTNTVVATGWANGITATDIANATVIVGLPVVPPLIHVTKIPSQFTLPAQGGMITYTEQITNPGTVALTNVHLTDDKCSPMNYISGDVNKDAKLDTSETWTYTCQTKLKKTTTNTAVASGEANGISVRDFAVATVVVALPVPKLPNTGFDSDEKNTLWKITVMAAIFMLVSTSLVVVLKKHKI